MKNRTLGLAAVFGLVLTGSTAAAPPVITQPDWLSRPNGDSLAEHYPLAASDLAIDGYAVISCSIDAQGTLVDCRVVAERPVGLGFGQAAISMSGEFQMKPQTLNGQPVAGGTVRIPIKFVLPAADAFEALPAPVSEEAGKQALRIVDTSKAIDRAIDGFEANARKIADTAVDPAVGHAAADAYRRAFTAHREDLRRNYAYAFASVFSEAEMTAIADYALTSRDQAKEDDLFAKTQGLIVKDYARNLSAAGRAAFCAKAACVGDADVQRVWRPADARDTSRIDIPQWAWQPAPGAIAGVTPKVARALGLTAVVRMTCKVVANGDLSACGVDQMAPAGLGFGEAALKLSSGYRLGPIQLASGAAGRRVTVRVGFPPPEPQEAFRLQPGPEKAVAVARQLASDQHMADQIHLETELEATDFASNPPKGSDPKVYDLAVEAYRTGAARALTDYLDLTVANLSTTYSQPQLDRQAAFRATLAGKAQASRSKELGVAFENAQNGVMDAITKEAHATFCAQHDCNASLPAQPKAASSAPSTRKP